MVEAEKSSNVVEMERLYFADWIRSMAVHLVVLIHTIISVDQAVQMAAKSEEVRQKKESYIRTQIQIGIPTFFFISGIAASFFNPAKVNFTQFIISKFIRLAIPMAFSMIFFLLPRLYIS
jgi:peptidoglycan/LPS O-acetylase OafA/YrhL